MSYSRTYLFVVLASGLIFSGCSENINRKPGVYVEGAPTTWVSMSDDGVMVSVNGVSLTKRDFNTLASLRVLLSTMQRGKPSCALPGKEDLGEMAAGLVMELIHHELFRQYAEKNEIRPTDEQVAEAKRNMIAVLRLPRETDFESLSASFPPDLRELFRKMPYYDAQDHLLRQSVTTNDLSHVSDEEIAARERFVVEFDANAERLNAEQRQKLEVARKAIESGEDFGAVSARCSEVSPEHGTKWAAVELGELPQDEDLVGWLKTAKVGDVSGPLDLPDGLGLVKLVSMTKGEAPKDVEPPDVYVLVKCTVRAFEKMQYQDRPTMVRQLLAWKRQEAQKKLGMMLYEQAVIVYPNGTEFFPEFDRLYNESQGEKK